MALRNWSLKFISVVMVSYSFFIVTKQVTSVIILFDEEWNKNRHNSDAIFAAVRPVVGGNKYHVFWEDKIFTKHQVSVSSHLCCYRHTQFTSNPFKHHIKYFTSDFQEFHFYMSAPHLMTVYTHFRFCILNNSDVWMSFSNCSAFLSTVTDYYY